MMINRWISLVVIMLCALQATAQPPLSKRLQKEKAEFEAKIAAEEKYDSLVIAADQAFENKDYVLARMTYQDAIPYNSEKEQWLVSKVNDLDILMAKNAAREVDSILVALPKKESQAIQTKASEPEIADRALPEPPKVEVVDEIEEEIEIAVEEKEEEEEIITMEPEVKEPVVKEVPKPSPRPKAIPKPEPAIEKVKVKEDFSSYDNGITEETFNLDNHTVLRVVVKEGIDVQIFKRVKHNWGGEFYFLDGVGTTKRYWTEQVENYRKKYGSGEEKNE